MEETEKTTEVAETVENGPVSRRAFLGGIASLAAAAAISGCTNAAAPADAADAAQKPEADAAPASAPENGTGLSKTGDMSWDEALAALQDEAVFTDDLVLDDGTVIPALYVRVRNRINRLGAGIVSDPPTDINCWAFAMRAFSEDEAELYLQMPLVKDFQPADLVEVSGRSEQECADMCLAMSKRGILYRTRRGGGAYYRLIPQINGIWEYSINLWGEDGKFDRAYLDDHWNQLHSLPEFAVGLMDSNYPPMFRTVPVSAEVVGDHQIVSPYDDFEAIIRRYDVIARGDCVCRANARVYDNMTLFGQPLDDPCMMEKYKSTEILTGQEAEYYIENGIGWPISQDEAIDLLKQAVEDGMVIETVRSKAGEIFCCCHGDSCGILGSMKAAGGGRCAKNYSPYQLDFDMDSCLACGLCATRCNLDAITYDDDNHPETNPNLCIRCGLCCLTCPGEARKLNLSNDPDFPELAETLVENDLIKAVERMQLGYVKDTVPGA